MEIFRYLFSRMATAESIGKELMYLLSDMINGDRHLLQYYLRLELFGRSAKCLQAYFTIQWLHINFIEMQKNRRTAASSIVQLVLPSYLQWYTSAVLTGHSWHSAVRFYPCLLSVCLPPFLASLELALLDNNNNSRQQDKCHVFKTDKHQDINVNTQKGILLNMSINGKVQFNF